MYTVTSNRGTFSYTKFQWHAAWFLVWLGGLILGISIGVAI